MEIRQIRTEKDFYIEKLLLAAPYEENLQDSLIDADIFALFIEENVVTIAAVVLINGKKCELKAIRTEPMERNKGYAKKMLRYICEHYASLRDVLYVGIGNCQKSLQFFEKCGFTNSHIVVGYYANQCVGGKGEDGTPLTNKVYLKKYLESEIDVKRVVDLALEAGRILLKNGGEIFRVEETIRHICRRFHVAVDIFTLSHGIFISAENGMEKVYTKVKHVPLSAPHLGIVTEVNDLSREISAGNIGLDEAARKLREIDQIPFKRSYFQVLAAGLGSSCFGFLLGASTLEGLMTFVIGCLLYMWVLFGKKHSISKILINIVGSVIITTLALVAMHIPFPIPLRLDGMIIGSIMPLVPGVAFVNAIRDIADSDFLSGTVRMIDAILVFVYIALGVGMTLSIYNNMLGGLV